MSQEDLMLLLQMSGKILNSRIGLVVLFMLYTSSPWGLGPQIDDIRQNTARLKEIQDMEMANTARIAQLVERCKLIEKIGGHNGE